MGRTLIFVGIIIDLIGTLFFVATLSGIGGSLTTIALEPLVCDQGAMLIMEDTLDYSCTDLVTYRSQNVTEQVIVRVVLLFMLTLTTGIALIIKGASELRKEQQTKLKNDWGGVDYISSDDRQSYSLKLDDNPVQQIPPEAQVILQQVLGKLGIATGETLSDRLQQLEDAYQQGLITQAEYQRVRQAILDRMDD